MTDKEKIREKVEKLKSQLLRGACSSQIAMETICKEEAYNEVLAILDSLQEESVSKDFEMALAEMVAKAQKCVVEPWVVAAQWKEELIKLAKSEEPVSEELEKAAKDFSNNLDNIYGSIGEQTRNAFKAGYHQAEKDMELTCEDIEIIGGLRLNVALELRRKELASSIKAPLKFTTEDMCKEVLKRFKEKKEK